ncbi:heparinase II/III family protein [Jeotgalicoccus psychrophilus]|uniref:heparinase II/III family protein n=1 Tax=Jeotgalicoccus psychrophilus TaxID=157228 RepID=UPI0003FFB1EA|nr:heparinase II/III family protein [Jeotgalicoccus psychrophilus]
MFSLTEKQLNKLNQHNGFNKKITHSKKSEKALENEYVFFGKFDAVKFDNKINWNYKHDHARATYQVYLHCLHMVRYLTNSYLAKNEEKYLVKAKEVIEEWLNSKENKSFETKNSAWKDHSAASRMKNIVYFQTNVPEQFKLEKSVFEDITKKHCKFLAMKEHYSENNHGMMSDEALLFLSNFITDKDTAELFQEKAILRMERIIYKLFSSRSYNLENSPEYHRLTQNLSSRFIRLVDMMDLKFDSTCRKIIEKSFLNNRKIVKPDLTYPLIGDTGLNVASFEKNYENFVDYQAGLAIINTKNPKDLSKSNWFSFKSGYLLTSHKHHDDLSINYFYEGEDILIDSGKYTYDRRNPKRTFISSPQGHSTIYKMNSKYNLGDVVYDIEKMRINFVYENDTYVHLAGINHLFVNIEIFRDIIYFEQYGFIVIDRYKSSERQFMGQNFNLHPDVEINQEGNNEFLIKTNEGKFLRLQEHTERTLSKYYSKEDENRGFYSEKFNVLLSTHQIEFRKNSVETSFITSLFDDSKVELKDVKVDKNTLEFIINNNLTIINLQRI